MDDLELTVLDSLPPLSNDPGAEFGRPELADAFVGAAETMAAAYATHFGLAHLAGRLRISCYHIQFVTFADERGATRQMIGGVVGPRGRQPTLTVLVAASGQASVLVCEQTRPWIDQFGGGRLPRASDEIDLDRP